MSNINSQNATDVTRYLSGNETRSLPVKTMHENRQSVEAGFISGKRSQFRWLYCVALWVGFYMMAGKSRFSRA
jgi:hypothetical protein